MKDGYCFDLDAAGLDRSYDARRRLRRIFTRCRLEFVAVEADSGAMGGSHRRSSWSARTPAKTSSPVVHFRLRGESRKSDEAGSRQSRRPRHRPATENPRKSTLPASATIDEVGAFLKNAAAAPRNEERWPISSSTTDSDAKQVKTASARRGPFVAFLRGDHQLNEAKLRAVALGEPSGARWTPESPTYSMRPQANLGPIGLDAAARIPRQALAGFWSSSTNPRSKAAPTSSPVRTRRSITCAMSTPGRDFGKPTLIADIRNINEGEPRPPSDPSEPAAPRQGRRDRPHLQARLQVQRVDGSFRSQRRWQGSHSDHGQLRHRPGAHPHRSHRVQRRSFQDRSSRTPSAPAKPTLTASPPSRRMKVVVTITNVHARSRCSPAGEKLAAELGAAALTCCSTTATSVPA